jgi:hypothetical protein
MIVTQAKVAEVNNFLNISDQNLEVLLVACMLATSHCCLQFFVLQMFEMLIETLIVIEVPPNS